MQIIINELVEKIDRERESERDEEGDEKDSFSPDMCVCVCEGTPFYR